MQAFVYEQATGELYFGAADKGFTALGTCYSGHGAGLNNPAYEDVHDVGPIPQGWYTIGRFFDDLGGKGPVVAHLAGDAGNRMFGRSGFMIHGDNATRRSLSQRGLHYREPYTAAGDRGRGRRRQQSVAGSGEDDA
jgi:hypothetical protein